MQANTCTKCKMAKPNVLRPRTLEPVCKACFIEQFELDIHHTIVKDNFFKKGDRVGIAISGGKDSTVLAYVISKLNTKYSYGIELILISIDEGIAGYRDYSLDVVRKNQVLLNLPLKIISFQDIYGWSLDQIVKTVGITGSCTYCGVFRRQSLDRIGFQEKLDKILTGHNADDIAETVILNIVRGDHFRLDKCVETKTGEDEYLPRYKPFKYIYEKEIVLYAAFVKIPYFSVECTYSTEAFRGNARAFLKDLEKENPKCIMNIIYSAESFKLNEKAKIPTKMKCKQCGLLSSNALCKACLLLNQLNEAKEKPLK